MLTDKELPNLAMSAEEWIGLLNISGSIIVSDYRCQQTIHVGTLI